MEKQLAYHILGIEETQEEGVIKAAYLKLLKVTNPEDNPEGFKRLREAYEEALRLCKQDTGILVVPEKNEVDKWIERIDEIYQNIRTRWITDCWKQVLDDPVCDALDTSLEAREKLIRYLMDHFYLPWEVWKLLDGFAQIVEDMENLSQQFPKDFLEYARYYILNPGFIPYDLFEVRSEKFDADAYIRKYLDIKRAVDTGASETDMTALEDLEAFGMYHPFEDAERMRILFAKGEAEAAVQLADMLTAKYPEETYLLSYSAEVYWETGAKETAYEIWQRLLSGEPSHFSAKVGVVKYELWKENYFKAQEILNELLEIDERDERLMGLLQTCNEGLIADYTARESLSDRDRIEFGWCLFQNDRKEEVIELLEDFTPEAEEEYSFENLYGRILFSLKREEEAIPHLERWLEIINETVDDGSAENKKRISRRYKACHILGGCHFNLNHEEEAERYVKLAIESAPNPRERHNCTGYLAYILCQSKQYERCVDVCDQMIAEIPQDFTAYVQRQEACFELKRAQQVVDDYHSAVDIYPGYYQPYLLAAEVFFYYKQYEDAKGVLDRARENNVDFSDRMKLFEVKILRNLAKNDEDRVRPLHIIRELTESVNPEDTDIEDMSEIPFETGLLIWDNNDNKKALEYLDKAIAANADRAQYRLVKGNILLDEKEYEKALDCYEAVKDFYKDWARIYYNIGLCYEGMKQREKAMEAFDKTIEMDPDCGDACEKMSDIYMSRYMRSYHQSDFDTAIQYITKQLAVRENCYYLVHRGLLYMDALYIDEAIADFKKALELEPEDWAAWNNLGCCYKYTARYDEAIECLKKAMECQEKREKKSILPYSNIADCYKGLRDYETSIKYNRKVLEVDPSRTVFWGDIGRDYRAQKKYKEAEEAYSHMAVSPEYIRLMREICHLQGKNITLNQLRWKKLANPTDEQKHQMYYDTANYYICLLHDERKGITYFEKSLEVWKKMPSERRFKIYLEIAEAWWMLHEYALAKEAAKNARTEWEIAYQGTTEEEFLAFLPERAKRLGHFSWLYMCLGEEEKAMQYLNQIETCLVCRGCNSPSCYEFSWIRGQYHEAKGEFEKAQADYEEAKRRDPDTPEVETFLKNIRKKVNA